MKKNTGFFGNLQKSTKVTLLSCVSFVILTLLILIFFILFPITPSEKIMASIGRENIFNNSPQNNVTAIPGVVTTAKSTSPVNADIEDETGTRTTKTYKIVITTGSGFLWNGRIPDGISDTKTTVIISDDPKYPTADPGYIYPIYTQPATDPNNSNPEDPYVTTPVDPDYPIDPGYPVDPVVTDPIDPPVTDIIPIDPIDPPQTQPPIIIDPPPLIDDPVISPDPNAGGGDEVDVW
ncbi:MAG: hypothetical protein K2I82_00645 [Ruminococcus sp.]|nr:hypothetical protein [Ruminococcus sp.]